MNADEMMDLIESYGFRVKGVLVKRSWSSIRENYWKRRANDPGSFWFEDERASKGLAPIVDGDPMILHHPTGKGHIMHFIEMRKSQHDKLHGG